MEWDASGPDNDVPVDRWKRPDDLSPADDGTGESVDFEEALSELEGDGVTQLVVGEVPEEAQLAVCRQLMGEGDTSHRRVLGLCGDGKRGVEPRLPEGATSDADHLQVVSDRSGVRGGVAVDPDEAVEGGPPGGTSVVTVDGEVGSFGGAITNAIADLQPPDGGFDPGELRVCVDDVRPLFEHVPREDVVQFVHLLGHRVRDADGKVHFHLPVDADDQRAALLATLCDVLIDVQIRDGQPRQQWHVRTGPTSEWLPVRADCNGG